ncbi:hypothetical protein A2V49_02325 [candidate division WWE3 bacterium RBG_19FT_COMBO_34_6]|uniref:Polysaccharide biosynthesis protein C-terminal domain-containing protein n=1 Tax=candidate division WWE3 bacterium RBG_19FT_COMBO_34_6 TaxID=1802612 RepID=A0A1F4UJL1_UNCKA|nr:MAG: hypothetical protein A2V49_02325 [candidate division WWE3 bacterium RBG_19FT_COMBO_34_6]
MKYVAKRFVAFPKYNLPSNLVNVIANQIPIILLGSYFGLSVVGQYALTQKILGVPGALISSSILGVFKERASRDYRETNSCRNIYVKTFKALFKLSIIPFLLIFFVSPPLIPLIFGAAWKDAGIYAQILTIMFFFRFISSPLSYVLVIAEKQKINLSVQICLLIVTIFAMQLGKTFNSVLISLLGFSIGYSIIYLIMLILSYKYSVNNNAK